ncbi:hypothetical protein I3843_15G107900 [Carya illinoinensis]|nr:hypothetical protein I3843_15G107900 [Carya illinoinensis]
MDRSACIHKVSDHIRRSNEEAYTPQVISIGPFHRNNNRRTLQDWQHMERFKLTCKESFQNRAQTNWEDIVNTIRGEEESVQECYSDRENLPDGDDFVNMILWYDRQTLHLWLRNRVQLDLILLENQLPFFIIEKIYDTALRPVPSIFDLHNLHSSYPTFNELTFWQFEEYNVQGFHPHDSRSEKILHFTDLLRNFCLPPRGMQAKRNSENIRDMHLARVGLKFKKSKSSNCSPLELKYEKGVLEIPRIQLDRSTEIYARNLIAFEQSHYPEDQAYITEYYFLLSLLIRGKQDVSFLVRKGIYKCVDHSINPHALLNRILETIDCSLKTDDYRYLVDETNKFYQAHGTYLHIMLAKLKRDYFSTPWKGAATIGGILLLLLTVIQTVCALISVKNWK